MVKTRIFATENIVGTILHALQARSNGLAVLGIAIICIMSGCTLQKRHHLPGYSVDWKVNERRLNQAENVRPEVMESRSVEAVASVDTRNESEPELQRLARSLSTYLFNRKANDSCDVLVTKDWEFIYATVEEISEDHVRFTKCPYDGWSGSRRIPIANLNMIKFRDGSKRVFEEGTNSSEIPNTGEKKHEDHRVVAEYRPDNRVVDYRSFDVLGIVSMCLTLGVLPIWWFVFWPIGFGIGILGMIAGAISIGRIRKHHTLWRGIGFGIVSFIVGLLIVVVTLIMWSSLIALL